MGRSSQWGSPLLSVRLKDRFLSLAMLEDKVFHMSVKDGCRTLGDMAGRCACKDKETRILLMWNSKGDCWKEGEMRFPLGLVAPVDSDVAGLPGAAGVDERRAGTISTPDMPSGETVESHQLTHIPFAPWCRACIAGTGREGPHFRQGEEIVVSLDSFSLVCLTTRQERARYPRLLCVMVTPRTVLVRWFQGKVLRHMLSQVFAFFRKS